jgi:CO dehydrogenase maturation factor
VSPEQLLGQLDGNGQVVVADFEAGLGTVSRMDAGDVDVLLLVVEPTQKSIQVGLRALAIIDERKLGRTMVIANRIASAEDRALVSAAFDGQVLVVVPEDPGLRAADIEGRAPLDTVPGSPAVVALRQLAESLVG